MNAEDCLTHRQYIDVAGPNGIYYPWVCDCPSSDEETVDYMSVPGYAGSYLVQCQDCEGVWPLYGFGQTPQDMGSCPNCGGSIENV